MQTLPNSYLLVFKIQKCVGSIALAFSRNNRSEQAYYARKIHNF